LYSLVDHLTIVAVLAVLFAALWKSRRVVKMAEAQCPQCGTPAPSARKALDMNELLLGGWTCAHCGARLDKWGNLREA
jgi:ribosomal protein L37AE/L43A